LVASLNQISSLHGGMTLLFVLFSARSSLFAYYLHFFLWGRDLLGPSCWRFSGLYLRPL